MTKYCWLDLETTGLAPENHNEIVEIGAIITDGFFNKVDTFDTLIKPSKNCNWQNDVVKMHFKSQLLYDLTYKNTIPIEETMLDAFDKFRAFLKNHSENTPLIVAGNSVHFDIRFLKYYGFDTDTFFSHRHLDISAIRAMITEVLGESAKPKIKCKHRALNDLDTSMQELSFYITNYLKTEL